jgi:hypothetical protein
MSATVAANEVDARPPRKSAKCAARSAPALTRPRACRACKVRYAAKRTRGCESERSNAAIAVRPDATATGGSPSATRASGELTANASDARMTTRVYERRGGAAGTRGGEIHRKGAGAKEGSTDAGISTGWGSGPRLRPRSSRCKCRARRRTPAGAPSSSYRCVAADTDRRRRPLDTPTCRRGHPWRNTGNHRYPRSRMRPRLRRTRPSPYTRLQ